MSKLSKTILIISITVFGAGFLLISPTNAQADGLVVEYWTGTEWLPLTGPIFTETNFLPGDTVTRLVKVSNNSGQPQRIATEAINYPGFISGAPRPHPIPDTDLSHALSIIIREKEGSDLYGSSTDQKSLYEFYQNGETYLSDISTGETKEYEFEIIFPAEKGNEWQAATTTFDILIGFQGVEGAVPPGGGVGLPPGLTINYERAFYIGTTTATITWTTSYFSTSQVIYDTLPGKFDLNAGPPKYGYSYFKEGDDSGLEKVTAHSVTITGLSPGTTYYYRAVSHASLAISREHSFTTLGVKEEELIPPEEEIVPPEERIPTEEEIPVPEEIVGQPEEIKEEVPEEIKEEVPEEIVLPEEEIVIVPPERGLASVLAANIGMILGEISQSAWKVIIVILGLIGLVLIGIRECELIKRKKKE